MARRVPFPPPVVVLGALAVALGADYGGVARLEASYWSWIGWALVALSALFLAGGLRLQIRAGTHPDPKYEATALVTSGVYRFTRNPMYVGLLAAQAGIPLAFGIWVGAALLPLTGFILDRFVIRVEEEQLARTFPEFEAYCDRVRRWL